MIAVLHSIPQRLRRLVGQLIGNEQGISAVEFALLLPLMVAHYLGVVEISLALRLRSAHEPARGWYGTPHGAT